VAIHNGGRWAGRGIRCDASPVPRAARPSWGVSGGAGRGHVPTRPTTPAAAALRNGDDVRRRAAWTSPAAAATARCPALPARGFAPRIDAQTRGRRAPPESGGAGPCHGSRSCRRAPQSGGVFPHDGSSGGGTRPAAPNHAAGCELDWWGRPTGGGPSSISSGPGHAWHHWRGLGLLHGLIWRLFRPLESVRMHHM